MSSINSIVLKNTYSSTQGDRASSILWRHAGSSGGITGYQSSIRSKYDTSTSGTNLEFRTYSGGSTLNSDTIAMTVQPDGNVSIGTLTTTNYKLDVNGTSVFRDNISGLARLDITGDVSLNAKLDTLGSALFRNRIDAIGDVSLNSNVSISSNIYYDGNLYKNGVLVNALEDASEIQANININNNIPSVEDIIQVKRHIIPDISNAYSLGSKDRPFKHLYVGPSSLYVNGKQVISDNSTEMLFKTDSGQSLSIQAGGAGQMKISSEQGGVVVQSTNNGSIQIETGTNGGISLSTNNGAINLTSNTGTYNLSSTSGNVNLSSSSGNVNLSTTTGTMNLSATNIVLDPSSNGGAVTIRKDLYVEGNIYKTGSTLEINVEQLKVRDNLITLNSGMTDQLSTLISGIEVNRGSNLPKYGFFFKEDGDRFVIGMEGEEQAVATRQDTPITNGVAVWNNTLSRFDTSANLTWGFDSNLNKHKLHVDGVVSSTEDITTASDLRLKKNVEPLSDMLNIVKELNPVSYELNYGSGKRSVGFIAQELQQHLPELVSQTSDQIDGVENPLVVSYQNMVAVLCKAVQELTKRVEELESR